MFVEEEWEGIISAIKRREKSCLEVILRTTLGPTAIERNFNEGLKARGVNINSIINWWSAGSSFGVLEIEIDKSYKLYAIWSQGEKDQVLKITPKDEFDLGMILDSLASSNVAPGVMRTFSHARFPRG